MESRLFHLEALEPRLLLSGDGLAVSDLHAQGSSDVADVIQDDLFSNTTGAESAGSVVESAGDPVDVFDGLFAEDLNPSGGQPSRDLSSIDPSQKLVESSEPVQQVVFIDGEVPDQETLVKVMLPGTDVFLLNATENGVVQIANALKDYSDLASVQIFSDDMPGLLEIGRGPPNNPENIGLLPLSGPFSHRL